MAEHINKTDTLNEGRVKLNEAINDSNIAKVKSESADVKATQALEKSTSTQTQLDTIVIDGDSSVEAAQARVDEKGVSHPTLKARIDDGLNSVNQQLAETTDKVIDNAISPDDFEGTDYDKVQAAIESAIINNKSIRFSRMYDITGNTLVVNKPTQPRTLLYFLGVGGGIAKNDDGYIFDTEQNYVGDIISSEMKYESVTGSGVVVWNGEGIGGIIRFSSLRDSYRSIDNVVTAPDSYVQSMRIIGCTITGGKGWAIEFRRSYDTTIMDNTIEHRENGIRNTGFTSNPDNNTLRIVNNVIEGLTGKGLLLGSSFGVTIQGNYMEKNGGGYFDLTGSMNYHNGLVLIGNTAQMDETQIGNNTPAFMIGLMSDGVSSQGNISTGVLFETTVAGTAGRVLSVGDRSYVNKLELPDNKLVREIGRSRTTEDSIINGSIEMYRKSITNEFFNPDEEKLLQISYDGITSIDLRTMVSVDSLSGSGDGKVELLRFTRAIGTNSINVLVKNNSTSSQNISVYTSLLQIRY